MRFSRNSSFLIDINGNLISVKFSSISRLIEFSEFLRHKVDTNRNLRLVYPSGFLRFWFGVRVIYYKAFLLIIGAVNRSIRLF
jgi:hypothetical protein